MSIATIVTAALRHVSWGKVANVALQYGPDLIRKLKGRQQASAGGEPEPAEEADAFYDRFLEMENALIQQDVLMKRQNERIRQLEETGKTLQARLKLVMVVSIVALILAVALVFWR